MLVEAAVLDRQHRLLHPIGIADSATGGAFSRSPPSAVSTGASSISRSLACRELELLHAVGRRRRRFAAPRLSPPGRTLKDDADDLPLNSGARGMIATAPADRELAGFSDGRAARSRDR
jgi:hypothetical protein